MLSPSQKKRVLFVLKQQTPSYGISKGLVNSAEFVANTLRELGLDTKVSIVKDDNGIDREIHRFKPNQVIIEAIWVRPSKISELARKYKKTQFSIRVHSKTAFLALEGMALAWLWEYRTISRQVPNVDISGNNLEWCNDMSRVFATHVRYLPNIYNPVPNNDSKHDLYNGYLHVGCFGAIRPLKNQLQQAIAAIIYANKHGKILRFHINSSRVEQKGDSVLKNLRALFGSQANHKLVEWPWMSHHEFVRVVKSMDLLCSVSLTESFCIVLSDGIANNVPCIGSTDTTWMPWFYRPVPTDTNSIVRAMGCALRFPNVNRFLCKRSLNKHNCKATKAWRKYLGI